MFQHLALQKTTEETKYWICLSLFSTIQQQANSNEIKSAHNRTSILWSETIKAKKRDFTSFGAANRTRQAKRKTTSTRPYTRAKNSKLEENIDPNWARKECWKWNRTAEVELESAILSAYLTYFVCILTTLPIFCSKVWC